MMKNLIRPTKITWIVFASILGINVVLILLFFWYVYLAEVFPFFEQVNPWPLLLLPIYEIAWLMSLFASFGVEVHGTTLGELGGPNRLGAILIVIGTLITLSLYYIAALLISKTLFKYKRRGDSTNFGSER